MLNEREQIWVETAQAAVKGYTADGEGYFDVATRAVKIADHVLSEFDKKFRSDNNG